MVIVKTNGKPVREFKHMPKLYMPIYFKIRVIATQHKLQYVKYDVDENFIN